MNMMYVPSVGFTPDSNRELKLLQTYMYMVGGTEARVNNSICQHLSR